MADKTYLIEVTEEGSVSILTIKGKISDVELKVMEKAFADLVQSGYVVVDLSGLEYICSWGFGLMVEFSQNMEQKLGRAVFVWPDTKLKQLFSLMQIDTIITLKSSLKEALEELK
jgi:anti-anti-sigma factor